MHFYLHLFFVHLSLLFVNGQESKPYRKILVFGGNGMIGSATVTRLLNDLWADVTVVNRGNWYWDTAHVIKSRVRQHISCDRNLPLTSCVQLMRELQDNFYHAVIDFSAYQPSTLQSTLSALKGRSAVYIYISTDSVYEVCADKDRPERRSRETDAVRPSNLTEREMRSISDRYGDGKLRCEELLVSQQTSSGGRWNAVPYVILRLPDVVGERDNTFRWWYYQLWMRFHKQLGLDIKIPDDISRKPMSLVYSDDVARLVVEMIEGGEHVWNEVYNVAFQEDITLIQLLQKIQHYLGLGENDVSYDMSKDEERYLYPSVTRGPVDTSKIHLFTLWNPSDTREVVRNLVNFYEMAAGNKTFSGERHQVIEMISVDEELDAEKQMLLRQLVHQYYDRKNNKVEADKSKDEGKEEL